MKQGFVHVVFSYQTTWCYVKIRNLFRIWHVLEIVSLLLTHVLAWNGMYGISKQYHKVTVHFLRGGGGGGALRSCMPLPSVNIFSYLPPPQKKTMFSFGVPPTNNSTATFHNIKTLYYVSACYKLWICWRVKKRKNRFLIFWLWLFPMLFLRYRWMKLLYHRWR